MGRANDWGIAPRPVPQEHTGWIGWARVMSARTFGEIAYAFERRPNYTGAKEKGLEFVTPAYRGERCLEVAQQQDEAVNGRVMGVWAG